MSTSDTGEKPTTIEVDLQKVEDILDKAIKMASKCSQNNVLRGIQDYALEHIKDLEKRRALAAEENAYGFARELNGKIEAFRDIIVLCQAWKVKEK